MGKIVTSAIRKTYRDLIKDVVKDLGESIFVYGAPTKTDCPNCFSDLVTGKSKNVFDSSFVAPVIIFEVVITPTSFTRGRCPVCRGEGNLTSVIPANVQALVKWNPSDSELEKTPVGFEGKNIVRIKARKTHYTRLRDCEYALIDGVRCALSSPPVFRGLGKQDELVVAFFQAAEVGHNVKS